MKVRSNVFAFCGMPGCGKGVITDHIREKGVPIFSMGDVVREFFAKERPGSPPEETGAYASRQREVHGREIWARRLIEKVEESTGRDVDLVMIDGLRSPYEREVFRKEWGPRFHVVAVFCPPDLRYQRLRERGRGDDPKDRKDFDERDSRELGWGLGDVIALADRTILNVGSEKELRLEVDAWMNVALEARR